MEGVSEFVITTSGPGEACLYYASGVDFLVCGRSSGTGWDVLGKEGALGTSAVEELVSWIVSLE